MEIVTGEPAPTVDRDEAARLLLEMAAVVRTIFAAPAAADAAVAAPLPAVTPVSTVPAPPVPTPTIPVPAIPVAGLPVPSLSIPAPEPDSGERHSLALLQEIAFLDD